MIFGSLVSTKAKIISYSIEKDSLFESVSNKFTEPGSLMKRELK